MCRRGVKSQLAEPAGTGDGEEGACVQGACEQSTCEEGQVWLQAIQANSGCNIPGQRREGEWWRLAEC